MLIKIDFSFNSMCMNDNVGTHCEDDGAHRGEVVDVSDIKWDSKLEDEVSCQLHDLQLQKTIIRDPFSFLDSGLLGVDNMKVCSFEKFILDKKTNDLSKAFTPNCMSKCEPLFFAGARCLSWV